MLGDLSELGFNGRMSFSGFGEPLLTKNLVEYVTLIKKKLKNIYIKITIILD